MYLPGGSRGPCSALGIEGLDLALCVGMAAAQRKIRALTSRPEGLKSGSESSQNALTKLPRHQSLRSSVAAQSIQRTYMLARRCARGH